MKKTLLTILAVIFSLSIMSSEISADAGYENIYELFEYWHVNGAPEWVASVSSTDGSSENLTVTLVKGFEHKEAELRSMLRDDSTLTVVTGGAYSEAEMLRIQQEITSEHMGEAGKVASCGVGWAVVNGTATGFGESGTESRVVVAVFDEYYEELKAELIEKYGDIVYVESTSGYAVYLAAPANGNAESVIGGADSPTSVLLSGGDSSDWVFYLSGIIVLASAAAFIAYLVNRAKKKNR